MPIPEYLQGPGVIYCREIGIRFAPAITMESLRALTGRDTETGIVLSQLNHTADPVYRKWFNTERSGKLMALLHPDTLFIEDPSTGNRRIRVPAEDFIESTRHDINGVIYQAEHPRYGIIGHFAVRGIDLQGRYCTIAYLIGEPELWSLGFGSAICVTGSQMLIDAGLLTLETRVRPENPASERILEKYFRYAGADPQYDPVYRRGYSLESGNWFRSPVD